MSISKVIVECNKKNAEWCPYNLSDTECDLHDPHEGIDGEEFDCNDKEFNLHNVKTVSVKQK